jgi:TetR/AcrR family fatty acid metabolism transcriptional regulator
MIRGIKVLGRRKKSIEAVKGPAEMGIVGLSKPDMLLRVAANVFAQKGYEKTAISEITALAKMGDSTVYEYFKGKEDLLFKIPLEKTDLLMRSLTEHLKGLKGAENKLRKVIWHYLWFQANNRDYATIILFELRPNRRFYRSEAYVWFRRFAGLAMDILKEGIEEGVFYEKTNLHLFRNFVFGGFDHLIYSWLLFDKPKNIVEQADDFFETLIPAIRVKEFNISRTIDRTTEMEGILNKRNAVLKVAEVVFAEKGFDKARISDISKALGIGEATIYEYFRSKEDILFGIGEDRTRSLMDSLMDELGRNKEAEMKLRSFVQHYLSFLQAHKDYTALLLFELRRNRGFYASPLYETVRKYNDVLIAILKQGQEEGCFRTDANIYLFRHMLFGAIDHMALTWILFGKPRNLFEHSEESIQLVLKAIKS